MSETHIIGKTPLGQFFYDVAFSDKKISYLERKWKKTNLRPLRYKLRAVLRKDKKAVAYWDKQCKKVTPR